MNSNASQSTPKHAETETPVADGQHLIHAVRPTAEEDRVPLPKRVAYGMGNLSDHIGTGTLLGNVNPIFNVALGLDPRLIGLSLGIMRIVDAFSDPVIGAISDNVRTKMGRRRPLMLAGVIGCGLFFPLVWMVPHGTTGWALFAWFTCFAILYSVLQSVYTIPFTALGFELTPDYNERTRVMEWRAYLGTAAGLFAPWAYAITQLPMWKGDVLVGARWMGMAFGIIILIAGLIPVIFLTERYFKKARTQEKIPILKSMGMTFRNRPFLIMILITLLTVVGGQTVNNLGFYIGLYYLNHGDTAKQAVLGGVTGNVAVAMGVFSVFVLNWISQRMGKRRTLALCLVLLVFSSFAKYIFLRPDNPYLSILVVLFTVPSSAGFWLLIASIKADICDDDELTTGLRREGAFGAIASWISKMAYSMTSVLAGLVLTYTGYHVALGAEQPAEVINRMRWAYYIIPSATAIPALVLLYFFPISEGRARETRRLLEERRGKL